MSAPLSVKTALEKNRIDSNVAFIVLCEIQVFNPISQEYVETLRIARNTEPVEYQGNSYAPANFDIELKQETGQQPTVSLNIKDYTRAVQGRMQAYGGGIGFHVNIMVVNTDALDQPPEIIEYFDIVGASSSNYEASFTLGTETLTMKQFPRRRQSRDFCQWRFRDPDTCAYTGSDTTCDLSLNGSNGCVRKSNSVNFGGCPGITSNGIRYL